VYDILLTRDRDLTGVDCGELYMSYKSIFQDVRDAIDFVHLNVSSTITIGLIFRVSIGPGTLTLHGGLGIFLYLKYKAAFNLLLSLA